MVFLYLWSLIACSGGCSGESAVENATVPAKSTPADTETPITVGTSDGQTTANDFVTISSQYPVTPSVSSTTEATTTVETTTTTTR